MKKLVFKVNGGKVGSFNSKEDLAKFIRSEFRIERFHVEDGNDEEFDLSIEECIDMLLVGDRLTCYNEELCERGDDYCRLKIKVK
jgi:hypothetical protein